MNNKLKQTIAIYLLSAIIFSLSAIRSREYVIIPIYYCIIVYGIKKSINKYGDK